MSKLYRNIIDKESKEWWDRLERDVKEMEATWPKWKLDMADKIFNEYVYIPVHWK